MVDGSVGIYGNKSGNIGIADGNSGTENTSELAAIEARNAIDPGKARSGSGTETESAGPGTPETGVKRGRGRPRKDGSAPKASNKPAVGDSNSNVAGIAAGLQFIHGIAALRVPELEISEEEALKVAEGWKKVAKYYPQVDEMLSEKFTDHMAFVGALSVVYAPRLTAITIRLRSPKEQPQEENKVVDLTGRTFHGPIKPN